MTLIEIILNKLGLIRKSELDSNLNFCRSVGKRLDEHREVVENILRETNFFDKHWNVGHMSIQDDYLMRLYFLVHGAWPSDEASTRNIHGEFVRKRPLILDECGLPEFNSETNYGQD